MLAGVGHPVKLQHRDCPSLVRAVVAHGVLVLLEEPTIQYADFPTMEVTCPHGFPFWVQPSLAMATELTRLNGQDEVRLV